MLVSTINSKELEASRVSRLLHDEVGQVLTAVGLQLGVLKLDFQDRLPELVERTNEIQEVLDQAVRQVRSLSYDLNPAVVERAGLQLALDRLIGRLRDQHTVALRYMYDSSARVPPVIGNAWYRIAELALDNAIRHSGATKIEIQVKPTPKGTVLEVRDNGCGFSVEQERAKCNGLGLLLMDYHASQASVSLDLKSAAGKGTLVRSTYTPGLANIEN